MVKQRDSEIGIMLSYLNKKKGQDNGDGVPVQRAIESNGFMSAGKGEEKKEGPTLYQMMNKGQSSEQPNMYGTGNAAGKSIKERRIEFELN